MWNDAKGAVAGIATPKGAYTPKTDDAKKEILAAATHARLENFNVKVNGNYIDTPNDLPSKSLAKLGTVEIEAYDIAG